VVWRHVRAEAEGAAATPRVLLISSFVRPHPGGVEEFIESSRALLEEQGIQTRVLACRLPGRDTSADAVIPTRFLGRSSWPLPTGGLRTLWAEVSAADAVVGNNARHLLPVVAVLLSRARGRAAFLVMHGSGAGPYGGSAAFRLFRLFFEKTLARLAMRVCRPVSVSQVGVEGARRLYGVQASYLPYPLRDLPPVETSPSLEHDRPMRITWVGRLFPEKDPLLAVAAVENLRRRRDAELRIIGDGPLRHDLEQLALRRPWLLVHGPRTWEEVQLLQAEGHACLATSVADATQLTVLEPLSRGIPTVSTRVGDAPSHYLSSSIRHLCVAPRDPEATADALLDLASSYDSYRGRFADYAELLRARHADAGEALKRLLVEALSDRAGSRGTSPVR
jgi:glycosyltransferase involved in cell wall biosynthesis